VALANLRYINALNNNNNDNANQTVSQSIFVYYGKKKMQAEGDVSHFRLSKQRAGGCV